MRTSQQDDKVSWWSRTAELTYVGSWAGVRMANTLSSARDIGPEVLSFTRLESELASRRWVTCALRIDATP